MVNAVDNDERCRRGGKLRLRAYTYRLWSQCSMVGVFINQHWHLVWSQPCMRFPVSRQDSPAGLRLEGTLEMYFVSRRLERLLQ